MIKEEDKVQRRIIVQRYAVVPLHICNVTAVVLCIADGANQATQACTARRSSSARQCITSEAA
jgi:hypothetical protein